MVPRAWVELARHIPLDHGLYRALVSNFYMAVAIGFVAIFAVGIWLGRTEAFVGNEQFLRAMIPHHSRAILVCNQAQITDPATA
ncbi:MAG: hypothetical protein M3Z20_06720 [Chloroflexota bacterium]|nr:hypothetical protein [Chloroflexota bacterium]